MHASPLHLMKPGQLSSLVAASRLLNMLSSEIYNQIKGSNSAIILKFLNRFPVNRLGHFLLTARGMAHILSEDETAESEQMS